MAGVDTALSIAREDLLIRMEADRADATVFDHSVRVARTALQLTALPEVSKHRLDRTALNAAALYHDAGWVIDFREQRVAPGRLLAEPTSDLQRERGASWMEDRLAGHISDASLAVAVSAIRHCNLKDTDQIEAQLVAEAENLDEIGPLSIGRILRRYACDPRGLDAVLASWHRQQEYHFWPARIKDCFRFKASKRLAKERLARLEPFMHALTVCHRGEDLAEMLGKMGVRAPKMPTA